MGVRQARSRTIRWKSDKSRIRCHTEWIMARQYLCCGDPPIRSCEPGPSGCSTVKRVVYAKEPKHRVHTSVPSPMYLFHQRRYISDITNC